MRMMQRLKEDKHVAGSRVYKKLIYLSSHDEMEIYA